MTIAYTLFVGKSEGKRPFGRPGRRWKDNIRMGVRGVEWEDWNG
jgi:hypothetical protein